jgi:hypothetical protein
MHGHGNVPLAVAVVPSVSSFVGNRWCSVGAGAEEKLLVATSLFTSVWRRKGPAPAFFLCLFSLMELNGSVEAPVTFNGKVAAPKFGMGAGGRGAQAGGW